jgi:hypothetical protein
MNLPTGCVLTAFGCLVLASVVLSEEQDFVGAIKENPDLEESLGLDKLSRSEQEAWNEILNRVFSLGAEQDATGGVAEAPKQGSATSPSTTRAYVTKIEEHDGDVLQLTNGAIVEVSYGYLGYLGYRKDCVVFGQGSRWRVWIEGKRTFACGVLKAPSGRGARSASIVYISQVLGDGKIIKMADGSMYEVDDIDLINTGLWLGTSEALVLDGIELINLDEGGESVGITRIR